MDARSLLCLHQLKRNLHLKASRLEEIQLKRLRLIIKHAYQNVPFYHREFDKARIKPDDLKSISDLRKFPLTTKAQIQASPTENVLAKNISVRNRIKRTTSGSTGLPLTTFIDKKASSFEEAVWARALFENGLRIRDKMAIIADPRHFPKKENLLVRLGIVRRKRISIFDNVEKQLTIIKGYKPNVLRSYTSSLIILAEALRNEASNFEPRLVFTSAELLHKEDRHLIGSVFKGEVLDNYACCEFSLLAWECRLHTGYHINVDGLVMEFLKDGEAVASGERGEVVCTSLVNQAMPLIRYRLEDTGIRCEEQCPCGMTLPLMKVVEGRIDDFLTDLDGRLISPTVFFPYPFEDMERIKQFRVIQERSDKLKIQLVVKENFRNEDQVFEKARRKIQNLFGKGMLVEFQLLEKIDLDSTGKLRKIVSNV